MVNREQTLLFLLIVSFATYIRDVGIEGVAEQLRVQELNSLVSHCVAISPGRPNKLSQLRQLWGKAVARAMPNRI